MYRTCSRGRCHDPIAEVDNSKLCQLCKFILRGLCEGWDRIYHPCINIGFDQCPTQHPAQHPAQHPETLQHTASFSQCLSGSYAPKADVHRHLDATAPLKRIHFPFRQLTGMKTFEEDPQSIFAKAKKVNSNPNLSQEEETGLFGMSYTQIEVRQKSRMFALYRFRTEVSLSQ